MLRKKEATVEVSSRLVHADLFDDASPVKPGSAPSEAAESRKDEFRKALRLPHILMTPSDTSDKKGGPVAVAVPLAEMTSEEIFAQLDEKSRFFKPLLPERERIRKVEWKAYYGPPPGEVPDAFPRPATSMSGGSLLSRSPTGSGATVSRPNTSLSLSNYNRGRKTVLASLTFNSDNAFLNSSADVAATGPSKTRRPKVATEEELDHLMVQGRDALDGNMRGPRALEDHEEMLSRFGETHKNFSPMIVEPPVRIGPPVTPALVDERLRVRVVERSENKTAKDFDKLMQEREERHRGTMLQMRLSEFDQHLGNAANGDSMNASRGGGSSHGSPQDRRRVRSSGKR